MVLKILISKLSSLRVARLRLNPALKLNLKPRSQSRKSLKLLMVKKSNKNLQLKRRNLNLIFKERISLGLDLGDLAVEVIDQGLIRAVDLVLKPQDPTMRMIKRLKFPPLKKFSLKLKSLPKRLKTPRPS